MINTYDKLPLGMYLDIFDLFDEDMDELERQCQIISILSGRSVRELMTMPLTEFRSMAAETKFLEEDIPRKKGVAKVYRLGDMELVCRMDITKITTAQYVDFRTYADLGRSHLPELLSVFLIPKGMQYNDGYDVTEVHRAIREHLSVTDATALSAFFLTRSRDLMQATLIYSAWMAKHLPKRKRTKAVTEELNAKMAILQTALRQGGDGWTMSARWLRLPTRRGRMSGE